jgi:hypothetical protein
MFSQLQIVVFVVSLCVVAVGRATEEEQKLRAYDGSTGYSLFAGTASPDGAWALAFAPTALKPEELKGLKEWPADMEIRGGDMEFDNFLFDVRRKRLAGILPDFDYFDGHGWRKNRSDLYVAWTPDSRHALAICEERWDDAAIAWIDPVAGKFPSVKEQMEKAYGAWLRAHEKHPVVADMQFRDPVALGPDVVVVDGWSQVPKDEPYAHYRLKMRFTPGKGDAVKCEILGGVRVPEEEYRNQSSLDQEGALQVIYDRLRAKLSPKAREALKQEQLAWLKTREALPKPERAGATAHRAALLRARMDFP